MAEKRRMRDEFRWLISWRLQSIDAVEKVFGVDVLEQTTREKRAFIGLEKFLNWYEATHAERK